ncbi:hypothetical protein CIPAW_07G074900 [Carya illinoinensis]|uniref:Endonuclease/exonuclease/phosphatase domain-containing protein n=1 Tax=Carya illinoinensis TaxID=32201 RepID=A0A8T1PW21_CARIL|nr:hypothetical protein CIPAW_07G074900 [Carya illinoinensis]
MWDRRVVEMIDHHVGEYLVACHFKNVHDGVEWAFAGVYGPNLEINKRVLWEEMAGIHCCWDLPWFFGGDFNVTRFPTERLGNSHFTNTMHDFSDLIFELELIDLPMADGDFTWSNRRSWSQLDIFLVSASW